MSQQTIVFVVSVWGNVHAKGSFFNVIPSDDSQMAHCCWPAITSYVKLLSIIWKHRRKLFFKISWYKRFRTFLRKINLSNCFFSISLQTTEKLSSTCMAIVILNRLVFEREKNMSNMKSLPYSNNSRYVYLILYPQC